MVVGDVHKPTRADKILDALVITALVFGFAIELKRNAWRDRRFWLALVAILVLLAPLEWAAIRHIPTSRSLYAAFAAIELLLLLFVLEKLIPHG